MSKYDVPDSVEDTVREGIDELSPDPQRVETVEEIRDASKEEKSKFSLEFDRLWYYEVRTADFDMGYDKIYYGFVRKTGDGNFTRHKQGNRDNS